MANELITVDVLAGIARKVEEGMTLTAAVELAGFKPSSVRAALRRHPEMDAEFERARKASADAFADQVIEISDTDPDPRRARVRGDARKWFAGVVDPKRYGPKMDLTVNTNVDIAGAISEGRSRANAVPLVPVCDQLGNVVYQPPIESTSNESKPGDNESPSKDEYDIFG
jgi:hypothetical protein